jgi:tetratricopeptide (TPR) repeat protein
MPTGLAADPPNQDGGNQPATDNQATPSEPSDHETAWATGGPVVAARDLKLSKAGEVLDTIQLGDLLTVLEKREKAIVIQTFRGHKGVVSIDHVSPLAASVPIYDKLILLQPDEGRLYTLRAGAQWAAGASDKALADFDQAIELGYRAPHAFTSRGLFHAASGNYDLAIADYSAALEQDSSDSVPLVNRASAHMAMGEYQKAIVDYTNAIEKSPAAALFSQRGLANKLLGASNQAIADYDRALELVPDDAAALMSRGFLHFQLKDHDRAIADFSRVIELSPDSAVAYNNRGYNLQQLQQFDKALADYRRAIELAPRYLLALQNKAWLLTTCEQELLRDPGEAIETAEKVCEFSEYKELGDLVLLAAAHASAGEFQKAIGWQEKALELAPDEMQENLRKILALYQDRKPLNPQLLEP